MTIVNDVPATQPEATAKTGRLIHGLDASEREQQRRDQILDSALTAFAEHGYANTSVEQVCQGANVSTKSFYRIFENREDLYIALFGVMVSDIFDKAYAELERIPDDEDRATDQILEAFVHAIFDDPRRGEVMQGTSRAVTPTIEKLRRENRQAGAAYIEGLWRRFGHEGNLSGVAVAVIGGIFDLMTYWTVDGDPRDPAQLGDLIADVKRFYLAVRSGLDSVS